MTTIVCFYIFEFLIYYRIQLVITVDKVTMLIIHVPTINQIDTTNNNVSSPIWLICMQVHCHLSIWCRIMLVMLPYNPYLHISSSNRTVPQLLHKKRSLMVILPYHKQDIHTMVNHKQSNNKQNMKTHIYIYNDCDFLSNFFWI